MGNVFNKQSLLTIKLETNTDISAASTKEILYKKPDGTTGKFTAQSEIGTDGVTESRLFYQVTDGDIDQDGIWSFQPYVIIGSLKGYGDVDYIDFKPVIS